MFFFVLGMNEILAVQVFGQRHCEVNAGAGRLVRVELSSIQKIKHQSAEREDPSSDG
jgi:hypothetical protein